jgi:thymidylate synthase
MNTDYTGKGKDQVAWCINEIKNNPTSRRLIVSAWNPSVLNEMCLNPCHVMYQFYCNPEKKELSVHMYQRSADVFLGLPFNIASTALFLHLMCYMTDYKPKDVVVSLGDAHIYSNHIDQCHTQLEREPYDWCKLNIVPNDNRKVENIEDFQYNELKLINYKSHGTIKAVMAV